MQKKKKKKHLDNFVGKNVMWNSHISDPINLGDPIEVQHYGQVICQKLILEVQLADGTVVGVNAERVTVCG